ncbi:phytanoyl-CoA dioxygenase family protein [Sphingomonas colocasiae]|uniref:Phytanoyl-CoA dioxygenase family protein n=1 Tax=Sphingomonas colocasiae TaxID=1848973 RepID=A0ABS7PXT6_9SPHN|nr:phytanoyl-CoA dioxygenase family protein [Sphingomonas colocasiae]MBY8826160.1 phytanoyl-CoA dioxygenase family protein [Sphingomonas colocasiae]
MTFPAHRIHPRNRDFHWEEASAAGLRRLSPAEKDQFDAQGFFVLRNVFTPAELDAVEAAIDPLEQAHEAELRANEGRAAISSADAITFTGHIVARSDVLRDFAAHPAIADVCHDLIGGDVRLYWDQSVYKKSGRPQEFPWHQDNGYTFVEPQQYLTFWIPLVDVDVENGCPWIAPGMHRLGTLEHWATPIGLKCLEDAPDAVPAPANRGDVIVFSSLAPHRTGPNLRAGTVRKAYILQYAPDGAEAVMPDGSRVPQTEPSRQFPILKGGTRI